MKKRNFVLSSIALGLSVFTTPMFAQADFPALPNLTLSPQATTSNGTPTLAPMLEKVLPSVVTISVEGKREVERQRSQQDDIPDEFKFFFGDQFGDRLGRNAAPRTFKGLGSGVVIQAEKGYILTNNHVIKGANKITVTLSDGRELKGKVVGADPQSDIALVQVEKPTNLTAIKLADSDKLRVGDFTVAIGNPFGLGQTVTSGIVSALGRSTGSSDGNSYENFIQTDAAVNQGNSGGALINLNGELIGINTAIISPSGGNAGIAFAIPSNMAKNLVDQIIEFGEVRRGMLGIKGGELSADLAKAFDITTQQGAFVSEVMPGSAAEKAGIKAGDVITALNGQKLNSFSELRAKIATTGAGKDVELSYLREGKSYNTTVKLQSDDNRTSATLDSITALEGAELANYNEKGIKGVVISNLEKNGQSARLGLKKGDVIIGVNRTKVENLSELRKILESEDQSAVALNILRDGYNLFLLIQ